MILINISNKNYNHCHFLSAYQAPGTVLEALMCTVTIPILQMSTLRHREFKPLTKLTQLLSRLGFKCTQPGSAIYALTIMLTTSKPASGCCY